MKIRLPSGERAMEWMFWSMNGGLNVGSRSPVWRSRAAIRRESPPPALVNRPPM